MFKKLLLSLALIAGTAWGMDSTSTERTFANTQEYFPQTFPHPSFMLPGELKETWDEIYQETFSKDGKIPYGWALERLYTAYELFIHHFTNLKNFTTFSEVNELLDQNLQTVRMMASKTEKSFLEKLVTLDDIDSEKKTLIKEYLNKRYPEESYKKNGWDEVLNWDKISQKTKKEWKENFDKEFSCFKNFYNQTEMPYEVLSNVCPDILGSGNMEGFTTIAKNYKPKIQNLASMRLSHKDLKRDSFEVFFCSNQAVLSAEWFDKILDKIKENGRLKEYSGTIGWLKASFESVKAVKVDALKSIAQFVARDMQDLIEQYKDHS